MFSDRGGEIWITATELLLVFWSPISPLKINKETSGVFWKRFLPQFDLYLDESEHTAE